MMQPITFKVGLFRRFSDAHKSTMERKRSQKGLLWLMDAMSGINTLYLRGDPSTPSIYDPLLGIRYEREKGTEEWKDIGWVLKDGVGDCEDLACARIAELRRDGIAARPWIKWSQMPGGGYLYHAILWRPTAKKNLPPKTRVRGKPTIWRAPEPWGGCIEDPSRMLGM